MLRVFLMSQTDFKAPPLGQEFEPLQAIPGPGLIGRMLGRRALQTPLPPGVRVYAVGDIHGCAGLLARACEFIASNAGKDAPERKYLVFMGDYVDRGPDSRDVIEQLIKGVPGLLTLCLRGNHDQSMLNFLGDPGFFRLWKGFGGRETLLSYDVTPPEHEDDESLFEARDTFAEAVPETHIRFLESLPYFVRIGGYLFVHAGFRPGLPIAKQRREDMLWIRDEFLDTRRNFGGTVVYGHTPSARPADRGDRVGIDTGAYATGKLTVAVFEGGARRFYAVSKDRVKAWD